jgi:rare lipoprotein A
MSAPRLSALAAAVLALSVTVAAHAQTPAAPAPTPAAPAAVAAPAPAAAPAKAAAAGTAQAATGDVSEGKLAYYGRKFNGRKTASGERFNAAAMTMAHNSLPFGTRVKVTNLANKRSVVVRVNDRGPSTPDRVGDLSLAAAQKLGATRRGVIDAKLEVVALGKARGAKKAKTA